MIPGTTINMQSSIKIPGSKIVYFDPFSISGSSHDADYVFITHPHSDHLSADSIDRVSNENTVFIIPESLKSELKRFGINENKIITMKPDETLDLDGLTVESVPAYNLNKSFHPKSNGWLGYVITLDGERIYACGDTDAIPEGMEVECDTAFIPVGGIYTMNAKEAADFTNKMKPKTAVPIHYGSFAGSKRDADVYKKLVDDDIDVEILLS